MPKCYLRFIAGFTALGLLTFGATTSKAELGLLGWTPMIGISSGPDQLVVGAHLDFGDLVPNLHFGLYGDRSEEHTSELQSRENLVCRLLLEKKKKQK